MLKIRKALKQAKESKFDYFFKNRKREKVEKDDHFYLLRISENQVLIQL